ncbi:MAG: replication factor C large subunit [Candidatus Thorarchaeota archaeon]|nr:MAG: replication factor C large subunit [Candidatus Thorarchaeota archaeon]
MSEETTPWSEKYRPSSMNQVVGNTEAMNELRDWVISWKRAPQKVKAILLLGPPGVGKTSAVIALCKDLNAELVEFNASDKRNKGVIETEVWTAVTQQTLDGRMRVVLLDEIDGLSGTSDRGGAGAILKVIADSVHPVVMTANDPESPRLKEIIKYCRVLTIRPIELQDMISVLKRIAHLNEAEIPDNVLEEVAEHSSGDLRAAISDLEAIAIGGLSLGVGGLSSRDVRRGIRETLSRLFMATNPIVAKRALSEADVDEEEMILWLEENMNLHLTTRSEQNRGYEALSLADLALGRIRRRQSWRLLAYIHDFISMGIVVGRSETPFRRIDYSEPSWPLLAWRGARRTDKIMEPLTKLSRIAGVSRRRAARVYYDAIEQTVARDPKSGEFFARWLGVSRGLLGSKASRR